MIAFHYGSSFYFLIPFGMLLGLYAYSRWRRLRDLQRLGDWRLVRQLIPVNSLRRRRTKDTLALIGLFFVIFSAAGPQFGSKLKEVKQRGVDVFIAMDTSRSMLAEDVPPSRLEHAKRAFSLLIDKLGGNRVGIIAFAKRAIVQCPLTVDNEAARMFLEIMDEKTVPEQGTAIGDAIHLALRSFPKEDKSSRVIVLLTDGEDHNSNPVEAAKAAKEAGVVLFTIGIGTSKGEVIKDRDEQGKVVSFHKHDGEMVLSRLDDGLLNQIAMITGGRYYRASSTDHEIDEIADILNGFEKKEFATKIYERLQERYQWFLIIGLLLLLIEFFFSENAGQFSRIKNELRRIHIPKFPRRKIVASVLIGMLFVPSAAEADFRDHIRKGNRLLKKGEIPAARTEFESARIDLPEAAFIPYNIAATYYLEGSFEEAKKQYEIAQSLTQDPALQSKIAYNMGHLFFSMGQTDQSINKFKECLRLNPKDVDAKYNIEYIKAGKKPKNPPPQKQNKGSGENKDNKEEQQKQNDGEDSAGQDQQEAQKKPGELSKENAERILQMMKDQESEKMKDAQLQRPGLSKPQDEKKQDGGEDW